MTAGLPLPEPRTDADSAPFWEGLARRELLVQRCGACGEAQLYFRAMCRHCWSRDLGCERASGLGTVYSITLVHQPGHPALAAQAPYQLALIDLDEGPRLLAWVAGSETPVGARVRADFLAVGSSTLLRFESIGAET